MRTHKHLQTVSKMDEIEVTIQSILPSEEPQGRFRLKVQRDLTVGNLLKELCKEAGVPVNPGYSLRSKGHDLLSRESTLLQAEVGDGAFLHWTSEEVEVTTCACNTFLYLAILSFVIGVGGVATICALKFKPLENIMDYAIVFDAGSTHSSMFIYKWDGSKYLGTAVAAQFSETCRAKGHGISSFEKNPSLAGASLEDCLKEAEKSIPSSKHADTPLYLGATAGMRLLNISNPKASKAILESVRDTFAKSKFNLVNRNSSVRIISGADEGTFSWVTSNYLTNAFDVDKPWVHGISPKLIYSNVGALDLGGASTQITFVPEEGTVMPEAYSKEVTLYGEDYTVYTHSYLCYGVMQMTNTLFATLIKESNHTEIEHVCLPKNYTTTMSSQAIFSSPCLTGSVEDRNYTFTGTGDLDACQSLISSTFFNKTSCPYTQCSFNGVYQPTVYGPFFAISTYFYEAEFLNLTKAGPTFSFDDYQDAVASVCNKTWEELEEIPASKPEKSNLMWYCVEGNYIKLLLHNNFNITRQQWETVNFVQKVGGSEVGWTLGFILSESDSYPVDDSSPRIYTVTFALLMVLFILFIVVAVGLLIQSRRGSSKPTAEDEDQLV